MTTSINSVDTEKLPLATLLYLAKYLEPSTAKRGEYHKIGNICNVRGRLLYQFWKALPETNRKVQHQRYYISPESFRLWLRWDGQP